MVQHLNTPRMSSAPSKRFVLYVSQSPTADDARAVDIMNRAPDLLKQQVGLVQVPATSASAKTPVLHDARENVTTTPQQTLGVLESLVRMAVDKSSQANVSSVQAERRAALLGRTSGPAQPQQQPQQARQYAAAGPSYASPSAAAAKPEAACELQAAGGGGCPGGKLNFCSNLGTSVKDTFLTNPKVDGVLSDNPILTDSRRMESVKAAAFQQMSAQFGGSGSGTSGVAAHSGYATHAPPSKGISMISDTATADGGDTTLSQEAIKRLREEGDERFKQRQQGKAVITAEADVPIKREQTGHTLGF